MISSNKIDDLIPVLRRAAEEILRRMKEKGYDMGISSTYRDNESQNALYAQGRTTPGNIITNARGGESFHNYRLAFDLFHNKKGDEYNSNILRLAGQTAMEMGLEWGGSWVGFVDMPHIQWSDGLTISDLKKGKTPADKKLPWEIVEKEPEKEEKPLVEEITIMIDCNLYKINRILFEDKNYVELRGFIQAGYEVDYDGKNKLPIIRKKS